MIETVTFQTRARTLDHLGREQIADVPTAISELWKNAHDAYASEASLTLYDGEKPVVALCDDGHGMSYEEFISKWLVIGTDSKLFHTKTPDDDRAGKAYRTKQGQKGIGRLSSARIGPLMLLVSKRKEHDLIAALIDWRVFENPFLLLSDIQIPVVTLKDKSELFSVIPELFDGLMTNVWGDPNSDDDRSERIKHAWVLHDEAMLEEQKNRKQYQSSERFKLPSKQIAETIIESNFSPTHLDSWTLWTGQSDSGTAMLISEVSRDFHAYLPTETTTGVEDYITKRFHQTLSAFVDPYHDSGEGDILSKDVNGDIPDFVTRFDVVVDQSRKTIVGRVPFERSLTNEMEHVLFGTVDEDGNFSGCVKAFGDWKKVDYDYKIRRPLGLKKSTSARTRLGKFDVYLSTIEIELQNTTHEPLQHRTFIELASGYSGFWIFRDGLRVLPYGREESDFFEIEQRRSLNAGKHFWNKRRMFGRVAITRDENPNLKDKAGREGFIDNTASKHLKQIVINILETASSDYFGRQSETRKLELPKIKEQYQERKAKEKADEDAKKLKRKRKKEFARNIEKANTELPEIIRYTEDMISNFVIETTDDIKKAQSLIERIRERLGELKIRGAQPANPTAKVEFGFQAYKRSMNEAGGLLIKLSEKIDGDTEIVDPKEPWELLESQIERAAGSITRRLNKWDGRISKILSDELERVSGLKDARKKLLKTQSESILELVRDGRESLKIASKKIDAMRDEIDDENTSIFEGYISALESLTESIDLQNIALYGVYEADELRAEVERLNELAQLGITVEILGHELMSYDNLISAGIQSLPGEMKNTNAVKSIEAGYQGLTKQLNFLAPLKVSGQRSFEKITGKDIVEYSLRFFEKILKRRNISLVASEAFNNFSIYDQPARIYPVFINLINNSQYWLSTLDIQGKQIKLDVANGKIIVSDNGPGVDEIDVKRLFQLFFTRKSNGGRGIGLYLCRANLRSAGHDIEYIEDSDNPPLPGANFAIHFSNAEFS